MLNRRGFLTRTLQGSSLFALSSAVPGFLANTARAAEAGKDTVLVVIEMTGGNDVLNTVSPYTDDLYHKARPTLHHTKQQVVRVDDHIGLNPAMRSFEQLLKKDQLAIVQGIGYPNPDRSHFEAMDIWHSADPKRDAKTGWLGRATVEMDQRGGGVPILHVGQGKSPLAVAGAPGSGAVSLGDKDAFKLDLGRGGSEREE